MSLKSASIVIADFDTGQIAGQIAGMALGMLIYQPPPRKSVFDAIKAHDPVCVILSAPRESQLSNLVADIQRDYPVIAIVVVYRIVESKRTLPNTVKLLNVLKLNGLSLIGTIHDALQICATPA